MAPHQRRKHGTLRLHTDMYIFHACFVRDGQWFSVEADNSSIKQQYLLSEFGRQPPGVSEASPRELSVTPSTVSHPITSGGSGFCVWGRFFCGPKSAAHATLLSQSPPPFGAQRGRQVRARIRGCVWGPAWTRPVGGRTSVRFPASGVVVYGHSSLQKLRFMDSLL